MSPLTIPFKTGRIIVLGDLHLDHYSRQEMDPFQANGIETHLWRNIDALILAGDLSDTPQRNWAPTFKYLKRFVPPSRVFVLPGNHDYYNFVLDGDAALQKLAADAGVNFVQKQELRHGNTRIFACTLWTDFALTGAPEAAMASASRFMRDYSVISKLHPENRVLSNDDVVARRYVNITPLDTVVLHRDHLEWLEGALNSPHFAGPTGVNVVVSHHGPHAIAAGPIDALSPAFHSDLEQIIQRFQPDLWFFGHSHRRFRGRVGRTDIRNVSIGYPYENRLPGEAELDEMCVFVSQPLEGMTDD